MRKPILNCVLASAFVLCGFMQPSTAANHSLVGTWHCVVKGSEHSPGSAGVDLGFGPYGRGWYSSDKTGGTHVAATYQYRAGILESWQTATPQYKSREAIAFTPGGFLLTLLGNSVNGAYHADVGPAFIQTCKRLQNSSK